MIAIVRENPLRAKGFKKTGVFGKIVTVTIVKLVSSVLYTWYHYLSLSNIILLLLFIPLEPETERLILFRSFPPQSHRCGVDDVPQEVVSQEMPAADFVEEVPDLLVLEAASDLEWVEHLANICKPLFLVNRVWTKPGVHPFKKLSLMRIWRWHKQSNTMLPQTIGSTVKSQGF